MRFDRRSGVFCHITSLPGRHGIGDLGSGARSFLRFLDDADQSLWQICPLGPTSGAVGDSPYQSRSAFAGNPLLISPERLRDDGWLTNSDVDSVASFDADAVDYDRVREHKLSLLRTAFERFEAEATDEERAAFDAFRSQESGWLEDYALFVACKRARGGAAWTDWEPGLRRRDPEALAAAREDHADERRFVAFCQWAFQRQWDALHEAAQRRGVSIVGDLPIYVALDSADVWAAPEAFQLDEEGAPTAVAGVPPNPGDDGQRWGNPLYDWDRLRDDGFGWWLDRVERLFDLVDIARIDHAKGLDSYYAIPADADHPSAGEWRPGPGAAFFEAVRDRIGGLPFVAEDLGFADPSLRELLARYDLPGMRVVQYADWCEAGHSHQPMHYPERSIGYTSTHDTDTAVGYYRDLDGRQRDCLQYNLGVDDDDEMEWALTRAVWRSEAIFAVTTPQDLLGLGSEARLNTPGTAEGNWTWRLRPDALDDGIAARLRRVTDEAVR